MIADHPSEFARAVTPFRLLQEILECIPVEIPGVHAKSEWARHLPLGEPDNISFPRLLRPRNVRIPDMSEAAGLNTTLDRIHRREGIDRGSYHLDRAVDDHSDPEPFITETRSHQAR